MTSSQDPSPSSCPLASPSRRSSGGDVLRLAGFIALALSCVGSPPEYSGCGAFSDSGRDDVFPRYRIELPAADFDQRRVSQCTTETIPRPDYKLPLGVRLLGWFAPDSRERSPNGAMGYELRLVVRVAGKSLSPEQDRATSDLLRAAGMMAKLAIETQAGTLARGGVPGADLFGSRDLGEYFLTYKSLDLSAEQLSGSTLRISLSADAPERLAEVEIVPALVGGGWRQ
jgi:hypothetical protein